MAISLDQLVSQLEIGGKKEPLWAEPLGAISPEELPRAGQAEGSTISVEKLRGVHHECARLLASGATAEETALLTGLSKVRVESLRFGDSAFKELVRYYEEKEQERFEGVQGRMAQLGMLAAEILQEKILDTPVEALPMKELRELMSAALDRGGHSPVARRQELKVTLSGEELQALKEQARPRGRIIEASVLPGDGAAPPERPRLETPAREGITLEGLGIREKVREVVEGEGE